MDILESTKEDKCPDCGTTLKESKQLLKCEVCGRLFKYLFGKLIHTRLTE